MADSAIQWCDKVWNPVLGCSRVSTGCQFCYAEKFANRLEAMGRSEYAGLTRKHGDGSINWTGTVRTLPERLEDPLRWKKPQRVFVNSMSDLFHEDVPFDFICKVFGVMGEAKQHTFQILTKRPERMKTVLGILLQTEGYVLPNVWLGVSVENQAAADERIPLLLQVPAAVRFLSCEPLLGPVDLARIDYTAELRAMLQKATGDGRYQGPALRNALTGHWDDGEDSGHDGARIDWVITGGESGGPADRRLVEPCGTGWGLRPSRVDWLRDLRDQCQAAGVSFFYKQAGGPTPKSGGRLLDGRTHDEWPATPSETQGTNRRAARERPMNPTTQHVTVDINGERTVLDGRDAAIIFEVFRCLERIRSIPVGHLGLHFDGRRVHAPELTERVLWAGGAGSTTG